MPPIKKTKTNKTTNKRTRSIKKSVKVTVGKKTAQKKITKKVIKQKEAVVFGLLQQEIDVLLENSNDSLNNQSLSINLSQEIAKLLPADKPIHQADDDNIVIKTINERAKHSPFVLDLNELVEKKYTKEVRQKKAKEKIKAQGQISSKAVLIKPKVVKKVKVKDTNKIVTNQFTRVPLTYHWRLPYNWARQLAVYCLVALMIVGPIKVFGYYKNLNDTKTEVTVLAKDVLSNLKSAGSALANDNLNVANQNLNKASLNLDKASQSLAEVNTTIKTIVNLIPTDGANLADAEYLISVADKSTDLALKISSILETFSYQDSLTLTDKITELQNNLDEILPEIVEINLTLNKIRLQAVPAEYQDKFSKIKNLLEVLESDMSELNSFTNTINEILGVDLKRSYLFVFQNVNEIRPTGGFMGSFAKVDFYKGEITNIEMPGGGIYDMNGGQKYLAQAPTPIKFVNDVWQIQDSNWFPNFADSAQKLKWFYETSGGPTVDGVIAINSSIVPKLLEITGPIQMTDYGITLTSDNFIDQVQRQVELNYDKQENKPKQILSDLMPILIDKLFNLNKSDILVTAKIFKNALNEKDIQMYFRNEAVQSKIASYNWTGAIKNTSKDYLAVINANIGGGKTDNYINQQIDLNSQIQANGEIINTVTITRQHTGTRDDDFAKAESVDYMRIYVPEGSQLISAEGFSDVPAETLLPVDLPVDKSLEEIQGEVLVDPVSHTFINNEYNKTVFANWVRLGPDKTKTVSLRYKLPFKLDLNKANLFLSKLFNKKNTEFYSLYLQKQSGQQNTVYNVSIDLPENLQATKLYNNKIENNYHQLNLKSIDNQDEFMAFILE